MKKDNLSKSQILRIQELQNNMANLKTEMAGLDRMEKLRWELEESFPELYRSDYDFFDKMYCIMSERRKILRRKIDYLSYSVTVERQKSNKKCLGGLQLVMGGQAQKRK
jgi:hypothetical protein